MEPTALNELVNWLNEGGKLTAASAIMGMACILRYVAVPIFEVVAARFQKQLGKVDKLKAVVVMGLVLSVLANLLTHSGMTFSQSIAFGILASQTAIGLLHTGKVLDSKASRSKG